MIEMEALTKESATSMKCVRSIVWHTNENSKLYEFNNCKKCDKNVVTKLKNKWLKLWLETSIVFNTLKFMTYFFFKFQNLCQPFYDKFISQLLTIIFMLMHMNLKLH